jgi:hypothetical protein
MQIQQGINRMRGRLKQNKYPINMQTSIFNINLWLTYYLFVCWWHGGSAWCESVFLPAVEHSSEGRFPFLPIRTLLFQNFLRRLLTVLDNAYKWLGLYVLSKETFTNKIIEIYSQLYYLFAKRISNNLHDSIFLLSPYQSNPFSVIFWDFPRLY